MASGTPTTNLGLRTMTDADSVDAQDINYNSGILDTKIGAVGSTNLQSQVNTLNTNISLVKNHKNLGTIASLSALGTALDSEVSNIETYSNMSIFFTTSTGFSSFFGGTSYIGTITKAGSNNTPHVWLYPAGSEVPVAGYRTSSGWSFQQIALKSDITTYNLGTLSSVESLETALDTLGGSMAYGECRDIRFTMSAADGLFASTGYIGRIMKVLNAVRYRVIVYENGSSSEFDGVQWGGARWTWNRNAQISRDFSKANLQSVSPYSSRCEGLAGGYIKVGNIVFVSIIGKTSVAISNNDLIIGGLPKPNSTNLPLSGEKHSDNSAMRFVVNQNGYIGSGAMAANTYFTISGCYISLE